LMVAGPLLDDGFEVDLLDAAREHWSDAQVVDRLNKFQPHVVMIGHGRLVRPCRCTLPSPCRFTGRQAARATRLTIGRWTAHEAEQGIQRPAFPTAHVCRRHLAAES
jgi:hypothetical protein